MSKVDLVVIGASAGGLEGLSAIVKQLSPSVPAAIVIVVHTSSSGTSYLPEILGRISKLPVALARDGDRLAPGRIFVAPPDFHLLVTRRGLKLTRGPRENGFRPAIDPLFRTAAATRGKRVMGVILSGALDDGTYGMEVIKEHGGIVVVQDPDEALIPSMPLSVLSAVAVDHVAKAAAIAGLIEAPPNGRPGRSEAVMTAKNDPEPQDRDTVTEVQDMEATFGPPSGLTCPDCGGSLWEIADRARVRYRCHVGHQFSPDALETAHYDKVEAALWTAVRALEEHVDMKQRMADRAKGAGLDVVREGFLKGAQESHRQAESIRELLFDRRLIEPGAAVVAKATPRSRRARPAKTQRRAKTRSRRAG